MPMTEFISFKVQTHNLENRRQTRRNSNRFSRGVIQRNRKVNSGRIPKENLSKDSKKYGRRKL
jgi:hypothetical protein